MYNPDFWEIGLDQADLEQIPNEAGIWFESRDERECRYRWEDRLAALCPKILQITTQALTRKQREAALLYFQYGKTQQEIARIMGISRRVVSQHIFGITRNGKQVGGAIQKIRKICRKRRLSL